MGASTTPTFRRDWRSTLRSLTQPRMLGMASLGFASGLPYMLIYSELAFWMKKEGVDLSVIGFFAWIGLAYTAKVFWAPLVDRVRIPALTQALGHRRSWMLVAILGTIIGMLTIAASDPGTSVTQLAVGAVILATSGATLDISIDAWRIEAAPTDEQTNMAATYILGYRLAIIGAGLSYIVAGWFNWNIAYAFMATIMAVNGCVVFFIEEPTRIVRETAMTIRDAVFSIRFGLMRSLLIGSALMVITNAAFAWLSTVSDPKTAYLFITVGADNLAAGFAATVFIAYLSSLCDLKFAATQYAFLSAMFNLVGKTLSGFTGQLAEILGFELFFLFSAALGLPAIVLAVVLYIFGPAAAKGIRADEDFE